MASIRRETLIEVPLEVAWSALRDVGALHTRLVRGFVENTRMEGDVRVVTFVNGMVIREPILDVDDTHHRVAWGAEGGALRHYSASAQVFVEGPGRSRFVWIADLLPNEAAPRVAGMIEAGIAAAKKTLEEDAARK
jgi:hypothetical protein